MKIIPLIILGFLTILSLGIDLAEHGQKKKGKKNAWLSLIAFVITWILIWWMLQ